MRIDLDAAHLGAEELDIANAERMFEPATEADKLTTAGKWIPIIVRRIVTQFQPRQIILFGSQARGDSGPQSDVDLLVVMNKVVNKRRTAIEIRRALADLPVAKDVVVTSPEEIAQRGDLLGSVLRPALREGKLLYDGP